MRRRVIVAVFLPECVPEPGTVGDMQKRRLDRMALRPAAIIESAIAADTKRGSCREGSLGAPSRTHTFGHRRSGGKDSFRVSRPAPPTVAVARR